MWWMSIKDAYKLGASIIIRLSQKGCISLVQKEGRLTLHISMTEVSVNPPQLEKRTPPKRVYRKYKT
jgi:hypothetical protein